MSDCGCHVDNVQDANQKRVLQVAFALNAMMFVIGIVAGWLAHSSGLLADALDMLSDSLAYAIALAAMGRTALFKQRAAYLSGGILVLLGLGVVGDTLRRAFLEAEPTGWIMIVSAALSLIVNVTVLRMLAAFRQGEVHLRATWICTRADVVANIGVIVSALMVMVVHRRWPDTVIGLAIGAYVLKGAVQIFSEARSSK
jgi:Co/Zn/Cd efflux system component